MELFSVLQLVVCLLTNCNRTTTTSDDLRPQLPSGVNLTTTPTTTTNLTHGAESSDDSDNEVILDDAFLADARRRSIKERKRLVRGLFEEFPAQLQFDESIDGAGSPQASADGGHCQFNGDCESGCCLAAERADRKCASKVAKGGRCENAQIKGGYYADFCPCQAGDGACTQTQGRKGGGRHMSCNL